MPAECWAGILLDYEGSSLRGDGRARPLLLEATAAVHRPVEARHERHRRRAAASCARHRCQLASRAGRSIATPVRPARRTALGLVEQSLLQIKALFSSGEDERARTVATRQ